MKPIFLSIVFSVYSFISANAQTNFYEAGYIVQQTDTIKGFLERTNEIDLSKSVNFRTDPASDITKTYLPQDLQGFGFNADHLNFAPVQVEIRKGANISQANRFAKILLFGYTNLYKLQLPETDRVKIFRSDNTFVYILQKENTFYTLGQYEFRKDNSVGIDKRYIGMLTALFNDCPAALKGINSLEFKDKALIARVSQYNECKAPGAATKKHNYEVKAQIKHGPEIGYARIFTPGSPDQYTFAPGYGIKRGFGFSGGYFLDILKPDISRKSGIMTGLNYLYAENPELRYKNFNQQYEIKVRTHSLRIPVTAQVNFNKSKTATNYPFINAGFTARFYTDFYFESMEFTPLLDLGVGMYVGKFRFAALLESTGFGLKTAKFINLTLGYRLDK